MSKKGFTLIELLAVIVILAIIALITTTIVLNIINQSKEASNKRSVEAYAKAVEYAVMEYEYEHNGELPTSFDAISSNVAYSNSDVKCNVAINCDTKGSVELTGCQVGSYTNNYYKYSSKKGNKGASIDEDNGAPSGNISINSACPIDTSMYETKFDGDYFYFLGGGYDFTFEDVDSEYIYEDLTYIEGNVSYFRKDKNTGKIEVCSIFSGGTICIEPGKWSESNVTCDSIGENCTAEGYVAAKKIEFENKGAVCYLYQDSLSCNDTETYEYDEDYFVSFVDCNISNDDNIFCQDNVNWYYYFLDTNGIMSSM